MILLKNAFVVDPAQQLEGVCDILIDHEKIVAVGENLSAEQAQIVDLTGKILLPGLIDMHVHLRDPGQEYKEDILSGTRAAAHGGFTSIVSMPNTQPPVDHEAIVQSIISRSRAYGYADVYPAACITKGQKGEEITEMGLLHKQGAIAFTDDGKGVAHAGVMRKAMDYSRIFGGVLISHCEDKDLLGEGVMNEGIVSTELGLAGIPNAVEDLMISRDLMLAKLTNSRLHIAHLSTKSGLAMIKAAKDDGVSVTTEVTPHHLFLTEENVRGYDTNTKVNPPLRTQEDCQALIEGLINGDIDCIVTDHAPHAREDKEVEYDYAAFGISGLETSLPLVWTNLYLSGKMTLSQLVTVMSRRPAEILGLDKGTLKVGSMADITIVDPIVEKIVDSKEFASKGINTPFNGLLLKGWPDKVYKAGRLVVDSGRLVEWEGNAWI